ncbi:hypothetical protein [Ruegeria arenilitoris]|uniref:hypothetical protein n=1 Tax=Ruegeria arenilitoris TaxID=1173585 RepID=UPI00147BE6FD|nr:hypothetical protein [Ruegeria arenilitoris]
MSLSRNTVSKPPGNVRCLLALVTAMVLPIGAQGDVTPYSGAEVADNIAVLRIEDEGVHLDLEIYPRDLTAFAATLSSGEWSEPRPELVTYDVASDKGLEDFLIVRGDGTPLPLQFLTAERRKRIDRASPLAGMTDPITGSKIPAPPDDPEVIYVRAFYDFEGLKPEKLIIRPPLAKDENTAVSIGFMVFDRAVPVTRFSFLNKESRFTVNWSDPWFTAFANANLNRSARSGTTSYLYVAPRELRHEVLIRSRDLAPWIDQTLGTGSNLDPALQSQILADALNEFATKNPVAIEGEQVMPSNVRGSFLTLGERGFQVVDGPSTLNADTTFIGVISSYPIPTLPKEASVTWDMFDDTIHEVPVTLTDVAGPFLDWATPENAKITWENHLKRYAEPEVSRVKAQGVVFVPLWTLFTVGLSALIGLIAILTSQKHMRIGLSVLTIGCLLIGSVFWNSRSISLISPTSDQAADHVAADAFSQLIANVYVAALEVSPEKRSEALAPIVLNVDLVEVSAELEASLGIRVPGGGLAQIAEVTDVVIVDGGLNRYGAFEGVAQWRVDARSGHWGHDHRRRVEYRARVEFRPERGHWKLGAITVLEARAPDV